MPSPLKARRSPRARASMPGVSSGRVLGSAAESANAAAKENHSLRVNTSKNDTVGSAKEKVTSKKRAASVGGPELTNLLKESQAKSNTITTSRRNAPAPRKSSIRTVPQIFLSPTGLMPSPESRKGLPMPSLTEQISQLGKQDSVKQSVSSSRPSLPEASNSRARDATQTISYPSISAVAAQPAKRSAMTQVIRPKRRVTFSSRQEKTEFARDEPTLRLQTLRREETSPSSVPASSSSVGFASFVQSEDDSDSSSDDDSDMDMDEATMDLAGHSLAASIAASLPHDDSTMDFSEDGSDNLSAVPDNDATASMQMTASFGSVHKRQLDEHDSSSHMDLVQAAPELKRRRQSDTDTASEHIPLPLDVEDNVSSSFESMDQSASNMNLDQTATMEFTNIMAPNSDDDAEESFMSDASDGMDMTKAITTRIEAKRNGDATTTVITELPSLLDDDDDDDDTMQADTTVPMDMTKAVTGFIREKNGASSDMDLVDQSSSVLFPSSDDASVAMDMTVPMGRIADTSAFSPTKSATTPSHASTKLGAGAPSPFQPSSPSKSPSKFRQSLRGGMAALETASRSPAQRIGGETGSMLSGRPAQPIDVTSFRRSMIGGVASPSYKHSPARRIATNAGQQEELKEHLTPLNAANLSSAGLSRSAQKASPSPASKFARMAALHRDRKSLGGGVGLVWPSSSTGYGSSPPKRRAGRSSLVAAILPDSSLAATNESFHSAIESGGKSSEDGEARDLSFANASVSDMGVGIDSFDDYSTEGRNHVPEQMPLNDFLRFVGVHFNDDMNASRRRPIPPSKSEGGAAFAMTNGNVSMMRLVKAACGSAPQLEALRDACREIKDQVDDGREKMVEMEQAFYDSPPDFVREIMGLQNEEEKQEMEAQFKLQKQAARALVCADYYGWRLDKEFDQEMVQTLQAYQGRLQCDLHIVMTKKQHLQQELLPVLRARHARLKADLEMAQARQAEIETCDADELKGLYSSIEEQHEVLESMRSKLMDVEEQHQRLLIRLEENREKMAAAQEMVDKAHATVDQIQGYTRGEAGRLLREIRNLEKLHLVRVLDNGFEPDDDGRSSRVDQSTRDVVLILDGWLQVAMSLVGLQNGASSTAVRVSRIKLKQKGKTSTEFGTNMVRSLALQVLQTDFDADSENGYAQDGLVVLRRISRTLIRQRILLAEIEHLRCRFPVHLIPTTNSDPEDSSRAESEVSLQASVLLPNKRSKIVITATSDLKGAGESRSILLPDSVKVEKVYGNVDAEAMSLQILDCIETDPTIGSLSKAFIETIETFDS